MTESTFFWETSEAEDVAGSIRHALRCWKIADEDKHVWKWVILALHSAVQGACVCHLVTTAEPVGAVTKKNAREWIAYFEEIRTNPSAERPKTELMNLPQLLKAIQNENSSKREAGEKEINISQSEYRWLKRIHDSLRNPLTHFAPAGMYVELSGMPNLAHLIARIIQDILDNGWAFRHLTDEQRDALKNDLEKLSKMKLASRC